MEDVVVDILIITALEEELKALRRQIQLDRRRESSTSSLSYHIGTIQAENDNVTYSCGATCLFAMGNTDSGISATNAIHDLNPTYVIVLGLAAGIRGKVKLGDVILPTHIFYYELAKLGHKNVEIRPQSYHPDSLLLNKLNDFSTTYESEHGVKRGAFAVGEKVIANKASVDDLIKSQPKLVGIEMESYGVAHAVAEASYRPRFIAIRGVSDFADETKNDDYRTVALDNATTFLISFLKTGTLPKNGQSVESTKPLIAIHHLSMDKRSSVKGSLQDSDEFALLKFEELWLDQTDLYENGTISDPTEAFRRQRILVAKLDSIRETYPSSPIGYFGLAHIPLTFHLGYVVNRQPVTVFATDRQSGKWIKLESFDSDLELRLEESPQDLTMASSEIAIRVSVSYLIGLDQIRGAVESPLASYHLRLESPAPDAVTSESQLNRYAKQFHNLLVRIKSLHPRAEKIHIFLAAPPTLAFRFGQQVSKTIEPQVLVYNYSSKDQPNYGWAINLATNEVLDFRPSRY